MNRYSLRATSICSTLLLLVAATIFAIKTPFNYPEGDFWDSIQDYLRTGHVTSTFLPDTYPYVTGVVYRFFATPGVIAEQAVTYLLLALSILWFLRFFTQDVRPAIVAALIVSLDPDLLDSITRVWDTLLASLVLVAFAVLCLHASRIRSPDRLLLMAVVWGAGVSVRPNLALLFLPVAYVLWSSGSKRWLVEACAVAVAAFAVFAIANIVTHGSFYVPSNGPYNLFAGANPYSKDALLAGYNGEPSLDIALRALGVRFDTPRDIGLEPVYRHQALVFIRSHPGQWLWLWAIKLFNLLRPDLKNHSPFSPAGSLKIVTSLCVPLWLATLFLTRKLRDGDRIVLVIAAAYILPFLITNSDPRFRVPLDALVMAHAATLILRRLENNAVPRDGV